jgi:hypothetical protein
MARTRKVVAVEGDPDAIAASPPEVPQAPDGEAKVDSTIATQPWPQFLQHANISQIRTRYTSELQAMANSHAGPLASYSILLIMLPEDSITSYQLDQTYTALSASPPKSADVLLILLSRGGVIEPAYQISKVCKAYAKDKFAVAIPRHAKSAATLIALGADEIHMGPLGQLGPIDPQLGGLPALGVTQALQTIASLSQDYPGSAEMFARYLRMALTVEQIGYCDRVSASAVQYAERLLSTKAALAAKASQIAQELVYEYKDHGFVIDLDEVQKHLGSGWIRSDTAELAFAEEVYRHFDLINLFLHVFQTKRLLVSGCVTELNVIIFDRERE